MKEAEYKIRPQSHVYGSVDISFCGVTEAVPVILSRLHLYYFCNTQVCLWLKAYLEIFPVGPLADKKKGWHTIDTHISGETTDGNRYQLHILGYLQ